jgi:esterase/lipase
LVEAHLDHLRYLEERSEVPRQQRSFAFLQAQPTDGALFLPGEGAGTDEVERLAEAFHQRGHSVLASALALRSLDHPGRSPQYWQTCADEAEVRYDMLAHFADRIIVVGVGVAALIALHLATRRRVDAVVALFPVLEGNPGWMQRMQSALRRLLRREEEVPRTWSGQRSDASRAARDAVDRITVPLFVVIEDRDDRSDAGRSAQAAAKLEARATTRVRRVPAAAASARALPPDLIDEMLAFTRRK